MQERNVLVIGLGFMGGSLAAALKQAGWSVYLHHRREEVHHKAEELGYGVAVDDPREALPHCQAAVVCTPLHPSIEIVRELAEFESDCVFTDIGSTKELICTELRELGSSGRFVGSHPMAGSHLQGLEHANPAIFHGARCAITPHEQCPGSNIALIQALWTSIGCTCHPYTPNDHDQAVAEISHLPHALASAAAAALTDRGLTLAASGFRDTTRVAAGSPNLWQEIFSENRTALRYQLGESIKHLQDLRALLVENDPEKIQAWLENGAEKRLKFERK